VHGVGAPPPCHIPARQGSFGIAASRAARGTRRIQVALLGPRRNETLTTLPLTLCSGGPWDRGNLCRDSPRSGRRVGRAGQASGGRNSGLVIRAREQQPMAARPRWRFLHRPDATPRRISAPSRRIFASSCVIHAPACATSALTGAVLHARASKPGSAADTRADPEGGRDRRQTFGLRSVWLGSPGAATKH